MFCAPAGAGRKFWIFWMHPRPGEVCLADLGLAGKTRPVVIVSRSDPDAPRAPVVNAPLTTQNRESRYEVPVPKFSCLNAESVANVQGIASIPSVRLERRTGTLPGNIPVEIRRALSFALDLDH